MTYDPGRDRVVLFGRVTIGPTFGVTWELSRY